MSFGEELLDRIKTRKNLNECELDVDSIKLTGDSESIAAATRFLQFNFENLQ